MARKRKPQAASAPVLQGVVFSSIPTLGIKNRVRKRNGHYICAVTGGRNSSAWCIKCHERFDCGGFADAGTQAFWDHTPCVASWKKALAAADNEVRQAKAEKAKLLAFIANEKNKR